MKFIKKEAYNAIVIEIKGKLMGGPEAAEFHDLLQETIDADKKNIVIDMSDVKYVNSSGIGILIRGYTTMRNAGGDMKLSAISDKVNGVLSITKLDQIFEYFPTPEEAASSYSS